MVSRSAAQVMFQTVMTGHGTGGDILPDALGAYNFEVHLSKEDGTWKITSATWEPGGEAMSSRNNYCDQLLHFEIISL